MSQGIAIVAQSFFNAPLAGGLDIVNPGRSAFHGKDTNHRKKHKLKFSLKVLFIDCKVKK